LKTSSSWPKFSGRGFLRSITENIVIKDFRQPLTASLICWVWSCNNTMELHRWASTPKVLVSDKTRSRAAVHSVTRRFSATGSKQTPEKQEYG
jgi:hypothetical protein